MTLNVLCIYLLQLSVSLISIFYFLQKSLLIVGICNKPLSYLNLSKREQTLSYARAIYVIILFIFTPAGGRPISRLSNSSDTVLSLEFLLP